MSSAPDILSPAAMHNAYFICHNIQVRLIYVVVFVSMNRVPDFVCNSLLAFLIYKILNALLAEFNYVSVQELRSTFSHTKSINSDFSLVYFVSSIWKCKFVCGQDGSY